MTFYTDTHSHLHFQYGVILVTCPNLPPSACCVTSCLTTAFTEWGQSEKLWIGARSCLEQLAISRLIISSFIKWKTFLNFTVINVCLVAPDQAFDKFFASVFNFILNYECVRLFSEKKGCDSNLDVGLIYHWRNFRNISFILYIKRLRRYFTE